MGGVINFKQFRQSMRKVSRCACAGVCTPRGAGLAIAAFLASFPFLTGCNDHASTSHPIGSPIQIATPLGLPPVPIPAGNPPTAASIALGRRLFYDIRFSKDNSLSCASCHHPQLAFTDDRPLSLGVGGIFGLRHAPSLINAAYSPQLFWDGRARSLEDQVGSPVLNPLEMNQSHHAVLDKLRTDPAYKPMFQAAFGTDAITFDRVANAISSFERTILSGDSPFDRYMYGGDKSALSPAQVRGLAVFRDPARGNCSSCHSIGPAFALFTDNQFHNTGEGVDDNGQLTDLGRFIFTHAEADKGAFKTPSLRNVAVTGPYMHDGKLKTLKDVIDFYAGQGNSNPALDERMQAIHLTGQDRADLVEFMRSLTGTRPPNLGPPGKDSTP